MFWIMAQTPIKKQSNQDWNTPIHLESNGPHIKVPLIFMFLIMIFYLCFYHQLSVKWVSIDIFEGVLDILDKVTDDSKNICGFWHWMKCTSNWYPW